MTRHLLDSDGIIDALNGHRPTLELVRGLTQQGDTLCSCDVVVAEVYAGLAHQERATAGTSLSSLQFLPTSAAAARQAGEWRYDYRQQGQNRATTDCLIAAVAVEHQATVVTGNVRHFPQVRVLPLPRAHGGGSDE